MYVLINNVARSRDHSCRRKVLSIKYYERAAVAFFMQHAMRMRHIVICGLTGCTMVKKKAN